MCVHIPAACMQEVYMHMNIYAWMHTKPLRTLKPNRNNFVKDDSLYHLERRP